MGGSEDRWWARPAWSALGLGLGLVLAGCPATEPSSADDVDEGPLSGPIDPVPRRFAFTSLDGKLVSSRSVTGRMTVVAVLASYDPASQAQARFIKAVMIRHTPRINGLGLILEPAQNAPMVQMFAESFDLPYPLAMADEASVAGKGPFPGLNRVPSVLLLDRQGREVWRHVGLIDATALSAAIAEYDERAR